TRIKPKTMSTPVQTSSTSAPMSPCWHEQPNNSQPSGPPWKPKPPATNFYTCSTPCDRDGRRALASVHGAGLCSTELPVACNHSGIIISHRGGPVLGTRGAQPSPGLPECRYRAVHQD